MAEFHPQQVQMISNVSTGGVTITKSEWESIDIDQLETISPDSLTEFTFLQEYTEGVIFRLNVDELQEIQDNTVPAHLYEHTRNSIQTGIQKQTEILEEYKENHSIEPEELTHIYGRITYTSENKITFQPHKTSEKITVQQYMLTEIEPCTDASVSEQVGLHPQLVIHTI